MNDEKVRIWKETVVAYFKIPAQHSLGVSKTMKTSLRIVDNPGEIRKGTS
jgi:hypothetical protein